MPDGSDMLTTKQTAALLGVDRATVARWVRLGQLPAVRLPSGHWRIRRAEVDRLLREATTG
jgi:excisionase family DNA binding protein